MMLQGSSDSDTDIEDIQEAAPAPPGKRRNKQLTSTRGNCCCTSKVARKHLTVHTHLPFSLLRTGSQKPFMVLIQPLLKVCVRAWPVPAPHTSRQGSSTSAAVSVTACGQPVRPRLC